MTSTPVPSRTVSIALTERRVPEVSRSTATIMLTEGRPDVAAPARPPSLGASQPARPEYSPSTPVPPSSPATRPMPSRRPNNTKPDTNDTTKAPALTDG